MFILLSPAKKLREGVASIPQASVAALTKDAEILSRTTRGLSKNKLKDLMSLSDNLADLNVGRFQAIEFPHQPSNASPAALTFNGDVYQVWTPLTRKTSNGRKTDWVFSVVCTESCGHWT